MGEGPGAVGSAAATGTMCGSARVVLTCRTEVPDYDAQFAYSGIVEHGMLHPCGLLGAHVHAQTSAVTSAEHSVEVGLDHDALDAAADAGLAPEMTIPLHRSIEQEHGQLDA